MTTQYLEEAAQLADAVCIVDRGRVVARGTPAQLTAAIGSDRLELVIPDAARAPEAASLAEAAAQAVAGRSRRDGIRLTVPVTRHPGIVSEVVRALDGAGIAVDDVVLRPTTLDEAYLRITGAEPAREELPA
jgi:ABC-2 type transport system ATP-binding protein